ncbi:glycoside hydrolase family 3 N-terminal domain-containing protein [Janibacter terrae]|uniref:glycoside hydrolase family 3 N-terminal domain-containing protein n=1 Tax=Janibacter terrae TaxID=103817 RepID=UPI000AC6E95D|nr:glycoside hydrolase family 3 N-terminal domain-containing protein [Janibacter terrae]
MPRRATHLTRATAAVAALTLVGCGSDSGDEASSPTSSTSSSTSSGTSSTSRSTSATASPSSPSSKKTSSSTSTTTSASGPAASSCVASVRDAMTPTQQAGQLLMAAMQPGPATGLDGPIGQQGLGSMLYLGGWQDSGTVAAASAHLQDVSPTVDGTKVGMLVAADQEGGEVQQLTGAGFTEMPSALEQARDPDLRASAKAWGAELAAAGVNVNLAPVADTVPAEIGRANQPIGRWGRQYGSTPAASSAGAEDFARGMQDAGVEPTVKHFPGIGRITGNTDLSATGITDSTATTTDPYLAPFADNIEGGTRIVMVGSAHYSRIDGETPALFSKKIVDGMLREDLGFDGVVITDDVGAAEAVAATPVGARATKFIAAGGDIVLTADPGQVPTMVSAIEGTAKGDPAFARQVTASVTRVLTLKEDMGLLRCG